jgi:putative addiction module component (TIGR02574 family)
MGQEKIKQEIDKLNFSEKLLLVGDIWDSIAQDAGQQPLPEWQKKELDKRYAAYKAGKTETYDCQAVHDELRKKYGRQDPDKKP